MLGEEVFGIDLLLERDAKIVKLKKSNYSLGNDIASRDILLTEKNSEIEKLTTEAFHAGVQIGSLESLLAERDSKVHILESSLAERDARVKTLESRVFQLEQLFCLPNATCLHFQESEPDSGKSAMKQKIAERDQRIADLESDNHNINQRLQDLGIFYMLTIQFTTYHFKLICLCNLI